MTRKSVDDVRHRGASLRTADVRRQSTAIPRKSVDRQSNKSPKPLMRRRFRAAPQKQATPRAGPRGTLYTDSLGKAVHKALNKSRKSLPALIIPPPPDFRAAAVRFVHRQTGEGCAQIVEQVTQALVRQVFFASASICGSDRRAGAPANGYHRHPRNGADNDKNSAAPPYTDRSGELDVPCTDSRR